MAPSSPAARCALRQGQDRARRIQTILKRRFGLKRLRQGQESVINRVLDGQNTLAIMPTGAGKSLCYQLPALLLPGRTLVVSPLIALMKDQCETLCQRGIAAVQLNSSLDAQAQHQAEQAIADGSARIVLTTPERLAEAGFTALLQQDPPNSQGWSLPALQARLGSPLNKMVFYAQTGLCRWRVLLEHLQEHPGERYCSTCDNCQRIAAHQAELARRVQREQLQAGQAQDAPAADAGPARHSAGASPALPAKVFQPDDIARVRRYGKGRVVSADALSVTVEFEDGARRSFLPDYVERVVARLPRSARPPRLPPGAPARQPAAVAG